MGFVLLLVIGLIGGFIAMHGFVSNGISDEQYRDIRFNMRRK